MIDIIIPVYNAERFLKRCVDSILMQTNPTWNLILVDDGSIDNSGNLCDFYAEKYSNITSIHKPNGGVSSARNVGIDNSDNEYICLPHWFLPHGQTVGWSVQTPSGASRMPAGSGC